MHHRGYDDLDIKVQAILLVCMLESKNANDLAYTGNLF